MLMVYLQDQQHLVIILRKNLIIHNDQNLLNQINIHLYILYLYFPLVFDIYQLKMDLKYL